MPEIVRNLTIWFRSWGLLPQERWFGRSGCRSVYDGLLGRSCALRCGHEDAPGTLRAALSVGSDGAGVGGGAPSVAGGAGGGWSDGWLHRGRSQRSADDVLCREGASCGGGSLSCGCLVQREHRGRRLQIATDVSRHSRNWLQPPRTLVSSSTLPGLTFATWTSEEWRSL